MTTTMRAAGSRARAAGGCRRQRAPAPERTDAPTDWDKTVSSAFGKTAAARRGRRLIELLSGFDRGGKFGDEIVSGFARRVEILRNDVVQRAIFVRRDEIGDGGQLVLGVLQQCDALLRTSVHARDVEVGPRGHGALLVVEGDLRRRREHRRFKLGLGGGSLFARRTRA